MSKLDKIHDELKDLLGYECVIVKLETYNDMVTQLVDAEEVLKAIRG